MIYSIQLLMKCINIIKNFIFITKTNCFIHFSQFIFNKFICISFFFCIKTSFIETFILIFTKLPSSKRTNIKDIIQIGINVIMSKEHLSFTDFTKFCCWKYWNFFSFTSLIVIFYSSFSHSFSNYSVPKHIVIFLLIIKIFLIIFLFI